jgi:hypothetical protein
MGKLKTARLGLRALAAGLLNQDLQQNWGFGGTVAFPVDRANSVTLCLSSCLYARTGNEYDLVSVAWQYRWDGGF